jgi:lipopolysaccharide/colanic/teichoic acid biosynthesis glycosyltransferase
MPILSLGVPRLSATARAAKRALDIFVSMTILVLGAPLLALIGVAIKLDSPGRVLFRQPRAGRGARTFELLKFRSMVDGADACKAALLLANEVPGGVMFKIRRDPRITRVGRLLRRFSLDELPQMWNVLRGEMSLVGPRPLVLAETERLAEDWHVRRSELRPGITGPWQVSGRSDVPFDAMVRFDYQYVAGWSLARDLEILCATVPAVLSGRGAY